MEIFGMEIFIIFSEIVFHTDIHAWNSIRRLTLSLHVLHVSIHNPIINLSHDLIYFVYNYRLILKFSFSSTDFGIE